MGISGAAEEMSLVVTSSNSPSEERGVNPLVCLPEIEPRRPSAPTNATSAISEPPIATTSEPVKADSPEQEDSLKPVKVCLHVVQPAPPKKQCKEGHDVAQGLAETPEVVGRSTVKTTHTHNQPANSTSKQQSKQHPQSGSPYQYNRPKATKATNVKSTGSALPRSNRSGKQPQGQPSAFPALPSRGRQPLPVKQGGKVLHTTHLHKRPFIMSKVPSSSSSHPNRTPREYRQLRQFPGSNYRASPVGQDQISTRVEDWTTWGEVTIKVSHIPLNATTKDLWTAFKREGQIVTIELFEDTTGRRDGNGRVRFSPPPAHAFWHNTSYGILLEGSPTRTNVRLQLEPQRRKFTALSPTDPGTKYAETMLLNASCIDFGFMHEPEAMMAMYRVMPSFQSAISFRVNLHHREIDVAFQIVIEDPRVRAWKLSQRNAEKRTPIPPTYGSLDRTEDLCFKIPFAQPFVVHEVSKGKQTVLLISLETPPNFYRKYGEGHTHDPNSNFWSHMHAWFRQTDILYDYRKLKTAPLTLKKPGSIVDIGRWITYRFEFHLDEPGRKLYNTMCNALRDFNVEITPLPGFVLMTDRKPAVWDYIDKGLPKKNKKSDIHALADLIDEEVRQLSFPVRYQLEVCISQGYLNEHNIDKDFVERLLSLSEDQACDLLEYIANERKRIYRPADIFDLKLVRDLKLRRIPHYCVFMRSATVTPTTIYYSTPTVETSNRVVRQYSQYGDRFLRVRFTDERFQGRIFSTDRETMNEVFTRIKRTMINGIQIGDRHFEFLAFGNSQFREHGAYFFAPLTHLTCNDIRDWMGDFHAIKVAAKYAARLGQCFSTTRAISGTKVTLTEIPDVKKGKHTFTDGVGKIAKFLAVMAASELGLAMPSDDPPSVFQFRLGGCKGVLAVDPTLKSREIHIRRSQYKFPALHEGLEIIRWSKFAAAYLNRQLILVLSTLQVPDQVFISKLKEQLSNLELAMRDPKVALNMLQKEIDPNQMTLSLAAMVLEGFQTVREPFMLSLLKLWRAWSIKYLKEKAKILVNGGALLLGCIDETATLQGHFDDRQPNLMTTSEERINLLPEIFVQLSKGNNNKPEVITGPMLLARNPSLHPGDIRVVRGVDVPALHHLKDVVVLPQTGDRDISGMCSGGDLDGDDYLVMWDKDLLPPEDHWNYEPMDYTPPTPIKLPEVTVNDITSFFVTYIKNDSLPQIAHAHLATADFMDDGVKNERCLSLATLHSKAVDYVKTGEPAIMPPDLRPRRWPHFMEKKYKPKEQVYISKKVLGQLYDQVEMVDFVPEYSAPFDKRILEAYDVSDKLLNDATEAKAQYDAAMHRIMAQHEIATEFEVWSTFVMHHANISKDFKFHEELGEISTALKDRFRTVCYEKAGGKDYDKMGPFSVAMYKVTSEEMKRALAECREIHMVGGKMVPVREMKVKSMPLMSFPWLFQSILGKIANGELHASAEAAITTADMFRTHLRKPAPKKLLLKPDATQDEVETAEGVTRRGDVLQLFQDEPRHSDGGAYANLGEALTPASTKPTEPNNQKPAALLESQSTSIVSTSSEVVQENNIQSETASDGNTIIGPVPETTSAEPESLLDLDVEEPDSRRNDRFSVQTSSQDSPFELLESSNVSELAGSGVILEEDDESWTSALNVGTPISPTDNEAVDVAGRATPQLEVGSQISQEVLPEKFKNKQVLESTSSDEHTPIIEQADVEIVHDSSTHTIETRPFTTSLMENESSVQQEQVAEAGDNLSDQFIEKMLASCSETQAEPFALEKQVIAEDDDVPIDVQWAALWKKPKKTTIQLQTVGIPPNSLVNVPTDSIAVTGKAAQGNVDVQAPNLTIEKPTTAALSQIVPVETTTNGSGSTGMLLNKTHTPKPQEDKKIALPKLNGGAKDFQPRSVPQEVTAAELGKLLNKENAAPLPMLPSPSRKYVADAALVKDEVLTAELKKRKPAELKIVEQKNKNVTFDFSTQASTLPKFSEDALKESAVLGLEKRVPVTPIMPNFSQDYIGFDDWLTGIERKDTNSKPSQRSVSLLAGSSISTGVGLGLIDLGGIGEAEQEAGAESSITQLLSPLPSGSQDLSVSYSELPESEENAGVIQGMELEDVFKDVLAPPTPEGKGKQKLTLYNLPSSPYKPSASTKKAQQDADAPIYRFGDRPGTPSPQRPTAGKARMDVEQESDHGYGDFGDVSALDWLEESDTTEEVFITPPEGPTELEKLANLIDF